MAKEGKTSFTGAGEGEVGKAQKSQGGTKPCQMLHCLTYIKRKRTFLFKISSFGRLVKTKIFLLPASN